MASLSLTSYLVVDFSLCHPTTNLTLTVSVVDTVTYAFEETEKALEGINYAKNEPFMVFTVTNRANRSGAPPEDLIWVYSGDAMNSYELPPVTQIWESQDDYSAAPIATLVETVYDPVEKEFRAIAQCDQIGMFYYAIYLDTFVPETGLNMTKLMKDRLLGGAREYLRPSSTDDDWFVFGNHYVPVAATNFTIVIPDLKAGSDYKWVSYCENLLLKNSDQAATTFTTPSNGGKLARLTLTFPSQMSDIQAQFLVCLLSEVIVYPSDLVSGRDGTVCDPGVQRNTSVSVSHTKQRDLAYSVYFTTQKNIDFTDNRYTLVSAAYALPAFRANLNGVLS